MIEFFSKLFDLSDFPPRWRCGNWSEFLGWLHISSDLATWAAYFAIPAVLIYFARKRADFPFTRIFWLFAGFILACGVVHLIDAVLFWYPIYRISALVKFVTAVVSWTTVIALVQTVPKVIHFPSLAATNEQLRVEANQRQETERELRAAKARYEALLSGTRSIVWTTSPEGGFVTPQVSWERYTGQVWNDHRGFGWTAAFHEDDRSDWISQWASARGEATKFQASGRIWHHDSQSYRSFVAEAVPVLSRDGSIAEWVGTISDIEGQHKAEMELGAAQSELAQQKRELELIYEAAPVGMSLVDRDLKFLRINETLAKINGYSREYHLGRRLEEVLHDLSEQVIPIYTRIFATGQPELDIEIVGRTKVNDSDRTWLVSYYPLEVSDPTTGDEPSKKPDQVTAVSSIVQDITDRKLQEKRLQESERNALAASKSKSEFLANMSHEIRTPMAAILGYADVLLGYLKDPDNRNCVLVIKKNGKYLLELINDILDLSRIEANKLDLQIEKTNLLRLVADIRSLMHVRASEKNLLLVASFDSAVPEVIETDPTRLRQVLINLLGNAVKFSETGSVVLSVRLIMQPQVAIEFAVSDDGIGISKEQLSRLFKPFSQADTSVTRQYGGSGLGLAISQRLVEMLGGELLAESELGKGSTFRVILPIAISQDQRMIQPVLDEQSPENDDVRIHPRQLSCRVLVVDDRRDVRYISQHFLEAAGARVSTAEDGQEGIDVAIAARDTGEPFDVVVMDMQMPNLDGLQATATLRSHGIEWPVIALTADAMKGDRDRCLNGGCDDYLSKPIDQAELIEMIGHYSQDITIDELRKRRNERAAALRSSLSQSP